ARNRRASRITEMVGRMCKLASSALEFIRVPPLHSLGSLRPSRGGYMALNPSSFFGIGGGPATARRRLLLSPARDVLQRLTRPRQSRRRRGRLPVPSCASLLHGLDPELREDASVRSARESL